MKIKGNISILIGRDYTTIQLRDSDASTRFVEIKLTPEQLSKVLSRQADVQCEIEVKGLDKIGKSHENKTFTFEAPKDFKNISYDKDKLYEHALKCVPDGWTPDSYFNSQNTFFKKDGKQFVRVTIRRWVDKITDQ